MFNPVITKENTDFTFYFLMPININVNVNLKHKIKTIIEVTIHIIESGFDKDKFQD